VELRQLLSIPLVRTLGILVMSVAAVTFWLLVFGIVFFSFTTVPVLTIATFAVGYLLLRLVRSRRIVSS